ncbi:MAG: methionyl-tRNA formyltransferase [Clostridiales bacterium GWE2_32_10]|nr:MAG: methionyl-tRNA formyltransferase [Clostridiales bacterium GWE2_32_10]HBY21284.1 methionyl-tRNA formyltransferase [Clostridiales bacterium]
MRIVFMGTPEFAVNSLQKIINAGHDVLLVITKEDRPKGRGHRLEFSPVKYAAIENDLNILQPKDLSDIQFVNTIKMLKPDVIVVVVYGKKLPRQILEIPQYGCINIHPSLLPKYRGASPIHHAVLNGDKYTGVTIMRMDEGLDTGDILSVTEIGIEEKDTTGTLHDKLSILGAELLVDTLTKIQNKMITRIKQNEEDATYTKIIDKTMGLINWHKKSYELINFIRGLSPWPSAYTYYKEKMMKIWEAEKLNETYEKNKTGEIVGIKDNGFIVKTSDGSILVTKIQMQDSKKMTTADYMRGNKIDIGEVLDISDVGGI